MTPPREPGFHQIAVLYSPNSILLLLKRTSAAQHAGDLDELNGDPADLSVTARSLKLQCHSLSRIHDCDVELCYMVFVLWMLIAIYVGGGNLLPRSLLVHALSNRQDDEFAKSGLSFSAPAKMLSRLVIHHDEPAGSRRVAEACIGGRLGFLHVNQTNWELFSIARVLLFYEIRTGVTNCKNNNRFKTSQACALISLIVAISVLVSREGSIRIHYRSH